jgi:quinol-cytochrome oxidoreductase complex cytochrome b subunit/coenzyme F420-reducing hydrogenase delta subunit
MIKFAQRPGKWLQDRVDHLFSACFTPELNPMYHLGALSFYFFWIVAITGLYLFVFFETSISGAYQSIEELTVGQWYLGGIMRSLHRYASAAMAVTVTLHLFREFFLDRFSGVRWFSWFTGVPLLWLLFASAIGGYWLVWDQLAQYIAILTSELFDWFPIMVDPMARNFLNEEALSDRFFSLMVFLHIGIPLALLLGMFIHIQRITLAKTNPPRALALGTLGTMIVLSLIKPAVSQAPANLDMSVTEVGLDWFYLNIYPLLESEGPGTVWMLLGALTVFLSILPWLVRHDEKPVAIVDPANCNGCGWCEADCPYSAITMKDHDYKKGHRQAVVDPDLCTSCGICAGSCPSATPFRHVDELVSGINMPDLEVKDLLALSEQRASQLKGEGRVIVYGCSHGASVDELQEESVAGINLRCTAMVPPSFVDYLIRRCEVDGVFITGCSQQDCYYRLGNAWVDQRVDSTRMPHLRTRGAKEAVRVSWLGATEGKKLKEQVQEYRADLLANKQGKADEVVSNG